MDRFSQETSNFWFAWDNKTVIVGPNKNAFVIRDSAENVAMAEKLVEILGTVPGIR